MLRLCTLGRVDLATDGERTHPLLSQPKRLGLLIYLSSTSAHGYRRRGVVLPLFWPELDEDRARGALRQATYILRRDLGEGVIRVRGEDEIGVDPSRLWLDVAAFEAALTDGDYITAADLYRGDFLDGFAVPGASVELDEWVTRERNRLRGLASRAMWIVAEEMTARDPAAAANWIRRAVALAPDDELALRQALGRLDRIGDRAGALQIYHEFRDRLRREYEAEPGAETVAIAEALRGAPAPVTPVFVSATPSLPEHGSPEPPAEPVRAKTPPRRAARGLAAAAMAAALVISTWGLLRAKPDIASATSATDLTAADELLVADIVAPPADSLAAHALTELLRTRLSDSRAIRVVPRARVDQMLLRMQLPVTTPLNPAIAREMARRGGIEAIVTGELTPVGEGYVLSAQLSALAGPVFLTATETAATPDALIPALHRLTRALRTGLGESRGRLIAMPALQEVSTNSLRALELFTRAQDLSSVPRGMPQQSPPMMALLREAIAIDSTFAMAHRRLGTALSNLGLLTESLEAFRAAERFAHRLPDAERLLLLATLHFGLREWDRAEVEIGELLRLKPGDPGATIWQAQILLGSGRFDRAATVLSRDVPFGISPLRTFLLIYQGHGAAAVDTARAQFRRLEDSTTSPYRRAFRYHLAQSHAARAAYDSAIVHAQPDDVGDKGTPTLLVSSLIARGQVERALAMQARPAQNAAVEYGATSAFVATESFAAMVLAILGEDRQALRHRLDRILADSVWRGTNPADRQIRPILALALAGRAADARRELTAIERAMSADTRQARAPELDLAHGAVMLAEGHPRDAIPLLDRASRSLTLWSLDHCRVCVLPWLGRAQEAAGDPDAALATYQRFLETGDPYRIRADAAWRAEVLHRLGALHAARGDTAQAVRRFSEFLDLRNGADAGLQDQVREVRAARDRLHPR